MALTQTFYDQRRQAWKTQRHKIDDADGSDDDREVRSFLACGRSRIARRCDRAFPELA